MLNWDPSSRFVPIPVKLINRNGIRRISVQICEVSYANYPGRLMFAEHSDRDRLIMMSPFEHLLELALKSNSYGLIAHREIMSLPIFHKNCAYCHFYLE